MYTTLRRLHVWIGLFAFTSLAVMAAAGLHGSFGAGHEPAVVATREVPFATDAGLDDLALAAELQRRLALPLTAPPGRAAVRRDGDGRLAVRLWTPNGGYRVTLDERTGAARVERLRNSLGGYLNLMHAQNLRDARPTLPSRLWGLYVDASIGALLALVATGLALWLLTRPRVAWAWALFVGGAFAVGAVIGGLW
jgi:hypothetical protein